jgi:RNA polymerase sigma-70 factor (ECF subfamily)
MTEAEAISRAQAGEEASFEVLYHLHKRRVYFLCLRMTGDSSRAEDMTQEVFLQLYRKIGSFRGESAFATWLHRMTVNIVLMTLRKKRLPEESLEPPDEDSPVREIGTVDGVLHGSLDRITLERVIAELPPGYRIIFVLHDVEGYEHNEIAEMLGCSLGNSKSQLHKARMKLRGLLRLQAGALPKPTLVAMPPMVKGVPQSLTSKVKGPIQCHKCRLKCSDAEHYLKHKCKPAPALKLLDLHFNGFP